MELSSLTNHASLFEFARHRRPCRSLALAHHRKCRSRLYAIDDASAKKDSISTPRFLSREPLGITSICSRNKTNSSGAKVACSAHNSNESSESSDEKENKNLDWRAFRARLIANEQRSAEETQQQQQQEEAVEKETELQEEPSTSEVSPEKINSSKNKNKSTLGSRWAHPILKPEAGCVLIATDKLDELSIFERTVIILLSAGSSKKNEGPFGLILNRPLPHVLKDIRPQDQALAEAFGESQVHFGGPLVSDLILLLQGASARKGYQEVVPGIFYSSAEGLDQAVSMIKDKACGADDFRFFFGYAGWATGQLEREVEDGYWCVAACSTNLFISGSSINLWEEVLKLMGGQYAELSKKPKKRWFK